MICTTSSMHSAMRSGVTDAQAKTPAYDLAVTRKKELTAIFKRCGNSRTINRSVTCILIS